MYLNLTYKVISEIGVKEKYLRRGHYNSLKTWWARRPITTMRSLLIKEMQFRNGHQDKPVEVSLFSDLNPSKSVLDDFSKQNQTHNYKVLDLFAGGGSIPMESARLGFETYSSELNPVASLIQETIFNSLPIKGYSKLLEEFGLEVIEQLKKEFLELYSINGINPYIIFWSKTAKCKDCGSELDLRRLKYLSKKKNKITILHEDDKGDLFLSDNENNNNTQKGFKCKNCETIHDLKDIKEYCKTNKLGNKPFAICYEEGGKRRYKLLTKDDAAELENKFKKIKDSLLESEWISYEKVATRKGVINPTIYDLKTVKDFFNDRQLLVLSQLVKGIATNYKKSELDERVKKQIVLGLTSLIEFLVDWNSTGTMWISQNEQSGRSLAGPGVGMKWDYIEINPFFESGSNLKSKLRRVCATYDEVKINNNVNILRGSSANLNLDSNSIDIILTDPPYFDSIDYTGLSEFFRPWFEILLRNTIDENADLKNDLSKEAIVELTKVQKEGRGSDHYEKLMTEILKEGRRVLKDDGVVYLLYSHKTFEGWEVIARAFNSAGLFIDECISLDMERSARPRAMSYEALNGVIVFRLTKERRSQPSVDADISKIPEKFKNGELKKSQIPIYLASLAGKYISDNVTYKEAYMSVLRAYELLMIREWDEQKGIDDPTKKYLEYRILNGSSKNGTKDLLKKLNLLGENGQVKLLDEIKDDLKIEGTVLSNSISIFHEFKNNSKTKVQLDGMNKEIIELFFSIIAGIDLNTVRLRSSKEEKKVSRLILSKL